ncbi:MAG: hypothetical protein OQK82_04380 [Candidatus Pacearchaeota archaeon]|nr:hypothetical protein [Candidatus Pacearchaeota archaeon]
MRVWIIVFVIVFLLGSAGAQDQSINVYYNFSNSNVSAEVVFSSILLKVETSEDATCKYSTQNKPYSYMESNFDSTGRIIHREIFTDLDDGVYKYYVRCKNSGHLGDESVLEVSIGVNLLVSGSISLSEDEPLKEGKYDVTLLTSKYVSDVPILSYSYDGVNYNPVALSGSGKNFKGYLVVDEDFEEGFVSFDFSAVDLEGRVGDKIDSGAVFEVDTVSPVKVNAFFAEGYEDYVKLEWYFEEDYDFFRIYRSEDSNPDYTDFYKSEDDESFADTLVDEGETYYYRIAAVDDAGNEGVMSDVVSATVLFDEDDVGDLSLSANLVSVVNNFLVEIDSVLSEVALIERSLTSKNEREVYLFSLLGLDEKLSDVKSELNSLRNDVEKYKMQDLSSDELNKKIDSSELKLAIIRKKIPEDITILDSVLDEKEIYEDIIYNLVYDFKPLISERLADKSVKESLRLADEKGLSIYSDFYLVEVLYADGMNSKFSVVDRRLDSQFERGENYYFVETVSKDVGSTSEIVFNNLNYDIVDDFVVSFGTDTKAVSYFVKGNVDVNILKESRIGFVYLMSEDDEVGITGYFLIDSSFGKFAGFFLVVIVVVGIFVFYFFYKKKNNFSELYFQTVNNVNEGLEILKSGDDKKAESIYAVARRNYLKLSNDEKKSVYGKVESLRRDILIFRLERQVEIFKKNPNVELLNKLKNEYKALPVKYQNKISKVIEKLSSDLDNKGEEGEGKNESKDKKEKLGEEKEDEKK